MLLASFVSLIVKLVLCLPNLHLHLMADTWSVLLPSHVFILARAWRDADDPAPLDASSSIHPSSGWSMPENNCKSLSFIRALLGHGHRPSSLCTTSLCVLLQPLSCFSLVLRVLFLLHSPRADDKTLSFYNVVAGGTIHMVLQLRGWFCKGLLVGGQGFSSKQERETAAAWDS